MGPGIRIQCTCMFMYINGHMFEPTSEYRVACVLMLHDPNINLTYSTMSK